METGVAFKTKSDFAYRVVRDRIVSGDLAPVAHVPPPTEHCPNPRVQFVLQGHVSG